jgi:NitT/TauT family transport system substrate-binding protein
LPSTSRTLAALAATAALAAGLWLVLPARPSSERLVVATVRQPATSLFFVAEAAGCLQAEGIELVERTFDLGRDALVLLGEGEADVAIAYETPVLRAAHSDERIRILSSLHTSTANTRLVTRRSSGIHGFSDLRGRRLGAAVGTNADFFVDAALRFGGVPRSEVTIHDVDPASAVDALLTGRVDAVAVSDPAAQRAERQLGAEARVITTDLYAEFSLLTTRDDVVERRPGALRALLRALACGQRAAGAQPEDSVGRIHHRFADETEADLRAQLSRVSWTLGLDHLLVRVLRRERDWLRTAGHAVGTPSLDILRLLERRPLEAIDPGAVLLPPAEVAR